jgi:hypothetical protein
MIPTVATDFRRAAVCIYDWLKYGHKKTPEEQANGVQEFIILNAFLWLRYRINAETKP